jgi:transcriptional regulator with XRE-family HTH domain
MATTDLLVSARERKGWTQIELARQLGVAQSTVSRIEQGSALPRPALAVRLARLLEVSLSEIYPDLASVLSAPVPLPATGTHG